MTSSLHASSKRSTATPITKPVWVTPNEAIRISGIGRTMLYEMIANGEIVSIKLRGKRLISYASIETLGK